MMILLLKRCVFESLKDEKPPTKKIEKKQEIIVSEKDDKEEVKPIEICEQEQIDKIQEEPIKEIAEEIVEENILKPKRKGNLLFTITSNVKTANGRYVVTKIVEEQNQKMAQKAFEKIVKKELGKARSMTKTTIVEYQIGDVESVEEVVEKALPKAEKTEPTLFQKALDILCTSPYIHLYKTPRIRNNSSLYLIATDKESLIKQFKEGKEKAQEMLNYVQDIGGVDEKAYRKLINETRVMSGQEIKSDKSAIKAIGSKTEEALNGIIQKHEEMAYNEEHKFEIAEKNIKNIMASNKMHLYKVFMQGFEEESSQLIIADNPKRAQLIGTCNDFMHDFIKEHSNKTMFDDGVTITVGIIDDVDVETICKHLDILIDKDNACSQALVDPEFTIEKWDRFLNKVNRVENMSSQEKDRALGKLIESGRIAQEDVAKLIKEATKGGKFGKRIIGTI